MVDSGSDGTGVTIWAARRYAALNDWEEEHHNARSRTVTYVREKSRITVYYRSGTVATVYKNAQGARIQTIRASVDEHTLKELFKDVYYSHYDHATSERVFQRILPSEVMDYVDDESEALEAHVRALDEERTRLRTHRDKLMNRFENSKHEVMPEPTIPDFNTSTGVTGNEIKAALTPVLVKRRKSDAMEFDKDFYVVRGNTVSLLAE